MDKPRLKFKNALSEMSTVFGIIGFFLPDLKIEIKIILFAFLLLMNLIYILNDYVKQVTKLFNHFINIENEYTKLNNRHKSLSKLFDERITELESCKNTISDTKHLLFASIRNPNNYEKPQLINAYKFLSNKGGSHEQRNF